MKRREFLKAAGAGITASAVAAPAIAQSMPELRWRLTASWPKSLDTLYGAADYMSKRIAELSDNKFHIQVFAAGEIVPGLEKGTIDAAEWVGPYDDEKLGFVKIAKYYYYPGWWEGGAQPHLFVNLTKWNELPKIYQSMIQACAREAGAWMTSKYDVQNPQAVKRLVASGAELRPFPQPVMEASYHSANEIYAELAQSNGHFKRCSRASPPIAATPINGCRWPSSPTTAS